VAKDAGKLRVLVADDSDSVQRAVVRLLGDAFEIVGVVASGRELVDAARTLHPDVIVSDLAMPSLGGAEALKLLRDAGQMTPFVIMTATDWNPRKWIDLGAIGVVHKSDLHLDLAAAVRAAAAGEPFISRSALES
jgi:DNA-binding NarL/FixJ family response regulator